MALSHWWVLMCFDTASTHMYILRGLSLFFRSFDQQNIAKTHGDSLIKFHLSSDGRQFIFTFVSFWHLRWFYPVHLIPGKVALSPPRFLLITFVGKYVLVNNARWCNSWSHDCWQAKWKWVHVAIVNLPPGSRNLTWSDFRRDCRSIDLLPTATVPEPNLDFSLRVPHQQPPI